MTDFATIGAALSSLKTASEIVKFLRETDLSLERAELKLKLADLVSALADARIDLAEVQESLAAKDKRIAELEEAFDSKDLLVRRYDAYYAANLDGQPTGVPFCLRCWEADHKKRQLVISPKDRHMRVCTSCGQQYGSSRAEDI